MTAELLLGLIICHFVGDYILQSHWMASEKTKRWWPAIVHGVVYTLPFLLLTQSPLALLVIAGTHVIIDHYRLAKYVGYAKNYLAPKRAWLPWSKVKDNWGYDPATPVWMSTWLMIISDNVLHFGLNTAAVLFL